MTSVKPFLFGFVLAGCLGSAPVVFAQEEAAPATANEPATAFYCGHCQTLWVRVPQQIGKLRVYRSQKGGEPCADCKAAIEAGATAGAKVNCAHCGDLASCQITEEAAPAAAAIETDTAVLCDKCETIWVREAQHVGKSRVYRSTKKMVCPDCEAAVDAVMSGQEASHMCKTCGGELQRCSMP